jgi:hydrogenase maturation protease
MEGCVKQDIVILGVGNLLMSDDGIGVHAAQVLALNPPPGAEVVDVGTDVLSTLPFLEKASHALIIDAVRSGGTPGTLLSFSEADLSVRIGTPTAHAINVLASRHLMSPGAAWPEIHVLGVEPESLEYGMTLSPAVAATLPQIEQRCREIVAAWNNESLYSK